MTERDIPSQSPERKWSNEPTASRLWTNRPPEVRQAIADAWNEIDHTEVPEYIFRGDVFASYDFGIYSAAVVNTDTMFDSLLSESNRAKPLQVLDVGAGASRYAGSEAITR